MTKKDIQITGSPLYPIVKGSSAMITKNDGGTTRTSRVVKVIKVSDTDIQFETLNSVYHLHIKDSPLSGMMVKQTFHMLNLI